jgi:hypothetical protein
MLGESLRFPFQGDDWVRPFVIGSLCALGSFLIIPAIILYGYTLRMIRAGATGQTTPPRFEDWEELLIDGIKAYAVILVYTIPLTLVVFLFLTFVVGVGAITAGAVGSDAAFAGIGVVTLVAVLVSIAVSLAVAYVLPASLIALATQDDLGAAFNRSAIQRLVTSRTYFVGLLVALGVATVGGLVATPLVFLLVGFAVQFYMQVVIGHYLGQVAAKAAAESQRPGVGTAVGGGAGTDGPDI